MKHHCLIKYITFSVPEKELDNSKTITYTLKLYKEYIKNLN